MSSLTLRVQVVVNCPSRAFLMEFTQTAMYVFSGRLHSKRDVDLSEIR